MAGNPDFMNIQYDTIAQFVTEMQAVNNAGIEVIEGLTRALRSNTELWQGMAKVNYEAKHQEWMNHFGWMSSVLSELQRHGDATHQIYQEVENRNMAMWGGN